MCRRGQKEGWRRRRRGPRRGRGAHWRGWRRPCGRVEDSLRGRHLLATATRKRLGCQGRHRPRQGTASGCVPPTVLGRHRALEGGTARWLTARLTGGSQELLVGRFFPATVAHQEGHRHAIVLVAMSGRPALAHGGHLDQQVCVAVTLRKLVGASVGVPTSLSRCPPPGHLLHFTSATPLSLCGLNGGHKHTVAAAKHSGAHGIGLANLGVGAQGLCRAS